MKKIRRMICLLLVCCLMNYAVPMHSQAAEPFQDVASNAWYAGAVEFVYENGLMNGVGDDVFAPDESLDRAMFVTILGRMEGVDVSSYPGSGFGDVLPGQWYSPYVQWAFENGIVEGYGDGLFGTEDEVSRQQMAAMFARYLSSKGIVLADSENAVDAFHDADSVADWAESGLELMRRTGLIKGDEEGNFCPEDTATRAEAATIFMRLHNAIDQNAEQTVGCINLGDGDSIYKLMQEHIVFDETRMIHFVDNILLVFLRQGTTDVEKQRLAQCVEGSIVAELTGPVNVLQIETEPCTLDGLERLASELMTHQCVYYAGYDVPIDLDALNITSGTDTDAETPDWWYDAVEAGYVEKYCSEYLDPVTVGVIDNGIYAEHPEFGGRIAFATQKHQTYNEALYDPEDLKSGENTVRHGTHVTGILAAADDGAGMTGLSPESEIVFGSFEMETVEGDGTFLSEIHTINRMLEKGVKLFNCSFAYTYDTLSAVQTYENESREYAKAVALMTCQLIDEGYDFLIVQGAGNGVKEGDERYSIDVVRASFWAGITEELFDEVSVSFDLTYSELQEHYIIVGGVLNDHDPQNYTMNPGYNLGETVDICAPSNGIYSAVAYDPDDGDSYRYLSGTSMATPIVTGTAALVWAVDPEMTAKEVRQIVLNHYSYRAVGNLDGMIYSYPLVNTRLAVEAALEQYGPEDYQSTWKKAYLSYITDTYGQAHENVEFQLVYLDEDSIPELFVLDNSAFEYVVCMFDENTGTATQWRTRAGGDFLYQEKQSLILTNQILGSYWYQSVSRVEDGEIVYSVGGEIKYPASNQPEYSWDGTSLSKEAYEICLAAAFDQSTAKKIGDEQSESYTYEELVEELK